MQDIIAKRAKEAHSKATKKLEKTIKKGVFAFRAQMLLEEDDSLLQDEKYNDVISNTDVISVIITMEQSLTEMDEIQALLSQIKNLVMAAYVDNADTSEIKSKTLDVENLIREGNLFKAKKVLVEILEESEDLRRDHMLRWSRYTIKELNQKMESILALYKKFPTHFIEFEENPVHILTSYLEDIISATRDERFDQLEKNVLNFYLFYYQVERFLKEEKTLLGRSRTLSLSKIKIDEKELVPIEDDGFPNEEEGGGASIGLTAQEDVSGPPSDSVDSPLPTEKLKELYKELNQIDKAESFFAIEKSSPATEWEDDIFEEIDEEEISPTSIETFAVVDDFTEEKPAKPEIVPEKLKRKKMGVKPAKVQMLIKRKDKEEGKKLPGFQTIEEQKENAGKEQKEKSQVERTPVKRKAKEEYEENKAPVDMIQTEEVPHEEDREIFREEEEIDIDNILNKLDALAVKCMVNKNFELAIEYYDKIIMIDSNYKDAYAKRDECYLQTFLNMKEQFRELTEKAVIQDGNRQKTKKSDPRRRKKQQWSWEETFTLFSDK